MDKETDNIKHSTNAEKPLGEGIRSLKTSNVFRTLNFELYVKPVSIEYVLSFHSVGNISIIYQVPLSKCLSHAIIFQNKFMMWFGAITFTSCISYIVYMKYQHKHEKVYTALDDNDQLVLRKKRSGWD